MAEREVESGRPPQRSLPEALVRSLRHEVGDLLQKVYATVAILRERLPADKELEQGVLARLRSRGEICRRVLDTAHDFICAVSLDLQPVDLALVARQATGWFRERYPQLAWAVEGPETAPATADPRRAAQIAELLLTNACE